MRIVMSVFEYSLNIFHYLCKNLQNRMVDFCLIMLLLAVRQIKISNRSLVLSEKNIRDVMGDTIKQLALTSLAQPQLH